jgi:hypothetical protein
MTDLVSKLRDIVLGNMTLTTEEATAILDAADALEKMEVTA